jgi:hypothetical protein
MNATQEDREFILPPPSLPWRLLLDSGAPETAERMLDQGAIVVGHRSAVILLASP